MSVVVGPFPTTPLCKRKDPGIVSPIGDDLSRFEEKFT